MSGHPGARGLVFNEKLIFEQGKEGRRGCDVHKTPFAEKDLSNAFNAKMLREDFSGLVEVSEVEAVRHFTHLSQWNYGIDSNFYPLGSCTMKYNPKVNEAACRMEGFTALHPLQDEETVQGAMQVIYELDRILCEITGMGAASLQPAAGAQGEFAGLLIIRKHLAERGNPRKKVILPDSAHGTNPASATLCDYASVGLHSGPDGLIDPAELEKVMDEETAAIMLTNPNTLGLFEKNIKDICEIVHKKGGYVYGDGANLNALLGKTRFGDMGIDTCHLNLHKTFSTPHGGGGPGSGPVLVTDELSRHLPLPRIEKTGDAYVFRHENPAGIGALNTWYGNFGIFLRAYVYILTMGAKGLGEVSDAAVLNANYILSKLRGYYHVPYDTTCMHECIVSDKVQSENHVTTLDIAKALIDRGFHPPTIYFPLIVKGAMMIEPTESESRETIDAFINAMLDIAEKAKSDPGSITAAPTIAKVKRLDETAAARKPNIRYKSS